ncbi:MAG: protein kinase [Gemmatimonadota bacterium]|nr:protein kinase [Gemmatimonadota bacterium]
MCSSSVSADDAVCPACSAGITAEPAYATDTLSETPGDSSPPRKAGGVDDRETAALLAELCEALAPRFQVLRVLGFGGMGRVFLARDPALKRMVAIKVLAPALAGNPIPHARFIREAEAAAMVSHPNIVSVYEVGELPRSGTPYFIMQFVEGEVLDEEFPAGTAAPEARVKRVLGEIASALAAAHARGLVHRDIKPRNIILEKDSGRAMVLDFGISAALGQPRLPESDRLTATGTFVGTPRYMSPEQACGQEAGDRSDVYSLGLVGFELLTGRPPFSAESAMATIAAHIRDAPPLVGNLRPDVTEQLSSLVDRCLVKEPERRPAAAEIADYLLPSTQRHIEWPPPGLERIRGLGARLFGALAMTAAAGLVFFVVLALQPTFSSPRWHEGERSEFWRALSEPGRVLEQAASRGLEDRTAQEVDAAPIWFFLLGLSLVAITITVPIVARRGWRLASRMHWARRSGYPWRVLIDVAWDTGPDTAAVLNRTGIFALLDAAERARLLRFRRREQIWSAATLLLVAAGPALWLSGVTGGWSMQATAVVSGVETLVIVAPALLGALGVLWCRREQARILARVRPRRSYFRRRELSPVRPELVSAWLASAGRGTPGPARFTPHVILALIPAGMAVVALAAAVILMLVTFVVRGRLAPTRSQAAAWIASLQIDSLRPLRWQELDSVLARSSRVPGARPDPDTEAVGLFLLRAGFSGPIDRVWDVGPAVATAEWAPDTTFVDSDLATTALAQLPRPLTRTDLDDLARDTSSRWLGVWRRMAYSAPLPPSWGYRQGLPGVASPLELPSRALSLAAQDLAERNRAAAVLALARGDKSTALLRARESIAAARQFMRSWVLLDLVSAIGIASRNAQLIADIGRVTGDQELIDEAEYLIETLRRARSESYLSLRAFLALMAQPENPVGLRYLSDTTLAVAVRMEMAGSIVTGYCMNAREVIFGLDPRRRATLTRAAVLLADAPRSGELIDLNRRWLDTLIASPAAGLGSFTAAAPAGLGPLAWFGLDNLHARLALCSQPF